MGFLFLFHKIDQLKQNTENESESQNKKKLTSVKYDLLNSLLKAFCQEGSTFLIKEEVLLSAFVALSVNLAWNG